jgi:hypothetical protein
MSIATIGTAHPAGSGQLLRRPICSNFAAKAKKKKKKKKKEEKSCIGIAMGTFFCIYYQ